MEEQQPKTGKFALNYGLLLGAVFIVFGVMLYTQKMHYETSTAIIVISIVLMAAAIFVAVNAFKKANGGYLTISEALKSSRAHPIFHATSHAKRPSPWIADPRYIMEERAGMLSPFGSITSSFVPTGM